MGLISYEGYFFFLEKKPSICGFSEAKLRVFFSEDKCDFLFERVLIVEVRLESDLYLINFLSLLQNCIVYKKA
jgi:hypothetical protein